MLENACTITKELVLESASTPISADWNDRRWSAALHHMEACEECSAVFDEFIAEPFVEDILRPVLQEIEAGWRTAEASRPGLLERLRDWSHRVRDSLQVPDEPAMVLATASTTDLLALTVRDGKLIWASSDCGRVRFGIQIKDAGRRWTVQMEGDRSLLASLHFRLLVAPPHLEAPKAGPSFELIPNRGPGGAYLDLDVGALGLTPGCFLQVRLVDATQGVTLRFAAIQETSPSQP